ncbi:phage tail tape measure protein [Streptomyces sp. NPDC051546]|uniref:phage tail tape measure protein n=1 Tax=Streptomyces sp. NPDC051546 TaxID=3365655 RepID=UPI00379CDE23
MGRPANLRINITSDSRQARQDVQQTSGAVTGQLDKLKAAGPALAATAALAIGAAIAKAFGDALEQGKITSRLGAQLGATPEQAKGYGKAAGRLYAEGITADFQSAADAISATMRAGLLPTGATEAQVKTIAGKVSDLATTFDQDSSQVARSVAQMVKTGMADSSEQAFDILTRGFQTGANAADDLLDTFNEYSTQFRKLGLDGQTAMGLIQQGLQGGARDADVVADALKEFSIRAIDGSKSTREGFAAIGLSAADMAAKFGQGGDTAAAALDLTMDRLRAMTDPIAKSQAAVALFGTQSEDLGKALDSLDPSTAVAALGNVGGAAQAMGDSLRDNASSRIEQFKRGAQQALVEYIGDKVIPMLEKLATYWQRYLSPVIEFAVKLWRERLIPVLDAARDGFGRVKDAVERNRDKLQPLIQAFRDYMVPALIKVNEWTGRLAGGALGSLFTMLARTIDMVASAVRWFQTFIGWIQSAVNWLSRLKMPSWLSKAGGWLSSLSGRAADAPEGMLRHAVDAAAPRAASPMRWAMLSAPATVVHVSIDGQQLQGRITRSITGALQAEGARYSAGGWA